MSEHLLRGLCPDPPITKSSLLTVKKSCNQGRDRPSWTRQPGPIASPSEPGVIAKELTS